MSYLFWPEAGELPSAYQIRQATDLIEGAHALGPRVLVNGVGDPARAALVADCWLAREGYSGARRLGWLDSVLDAGDTPTPSLVLRAAECAFVAEWPTGRESQC